MKKYLLLISTFFLTITTLFSNLERNMSFTNLDKSVTLKSNDKKTVADPYSVLENWYKIGATNTWKIAISRDKWTNFFLVKLGDALLGSINRGNLISSFISELKWWPNRGNRNFSYYEYSVLAIYIYDYAPDISELFFGNDKINRILIETDSDKRLVNIKDASI